MLRPTTYSVVIFKCQMAKPIGQAETRWGEPLWRTSFPDPTDLSEIQQWRERLTSGLVRGVQPATECCYNKQSAKYPFICRKWSHECVPCERATLNSSSHLWQCSNASHISAFPASTCSRQETAGGRQGCCPEGNANERTRIRGALSGRPR